MIQPTLSFCIAHENDMADTEKTLRLNLCNNYIYKEYIEFVIVDFSSEKNLYKWLDENCKEELMSGYVKYFRSEEAVKWHEAIVRNLVAIHASKDIIVSIDSGFILDFETTTCVLKAFMKNRNTAILINTLQKKEHPGHLAVSREYFSFLGGYDESFDPTDVLIMDLFNRLNRFGLTTVSYQQKQVDYSSLKPSSVTCRYTSAEYNRMLNRDFIGSKRNISEGRLIANESPDSKKPEEYPRDKATIRDHAVEFLDKCIERISATVFLSNNTGFFDGQAGILLLLFYYSSYKKNETAQSVSDKLLDVVVENISKKSKYETVSVVLSICYLMKEKFIEPDTSIFEDIDDWLFNNNDRKENPADFNEKLLTGIYIYYRMTSNECKNTTVWKDRMKHYFQSIHSLLCGRIYLYVFPVLTCSTSSIILYLCSKFENDNYFRNEIALIYQDLNAIIDISIREDDNSADKYLLSLLLKQSGLGSDNNPLMHIRNSVSLMDINHFFLYRYLLGIEVEIPEIIGDAIRSIIDNEKQINKLLSMLSPGTSGLDGYIAGFAWALLQWIQKK
jgi:hypothetical protein